jgi:hypothetical protein
MVRSTSRGGRVTIWEEYETDIDAYPLERTDKDAFVKWCHYREMARTEAESAGDDKKMAHMFAGPYIDMAREVVATYDPNAWGSPPTSDMGVFTTPNACGNATGREGASR